MRNVPLFADLPEADLKRLCQASEEVALYNGDELFAEGSEGDRAYVIQEGEMEVLKTSGSREVLLNRCGPGEVIGEMALLEEVPRNATLRACTDAVLVAIPKAQFDHLLTTSAPAANAMFRTILKRWRSTESMLRQSERMAQLGTLSAGVAHELNNPSAAVQRSASQLQDALGGFLNSQAELEELALTGEQRAALNGPVQRARERANGPIQLDALDRSDLEYSLESWLDERGVADSWELAPALAEIGYDTEGLESLAGDFAAEQLPAVVRALNATYEVHSLLNEVGQASGRISDIVRALKSYSYLDQAPVQTVDIHEGLDNTLLILRSKLQEGITVHREYAADLPKIQAYGSELNQVWTNLIDNAAYALDGKGEITIRSRADGDWIAVEVEDNGPGIPEESLHRIFDAFYTTKPPGSGTGLGLDITYNIVVNRHRGDIKVDSRPGRTLFKVSLPVKLEAA